MYTSRITKILKNILEVDRANFINFDVNCDLGDLGLDSIKFIKMVVEVEKEFGIEIRDSDLIITKFNTIANINETVKSYLKANIAKKVNITAKKVLVTDCDNVLWRGYYGEENVYVDEVHKLYHKQLMSLYNKGVIICICSSNKEENILMAFEKLPLGLHQENFVSFNCNCINKANALIHFSNELNLPLESFVFVDDSDYEIGLIQSVLPDVVTIKADVDNNSEEWIRLIEANFAETTGTSERTEQYKAQKEREKSKLHFPNIEEYNTSLLTSVDCRFAQEVDAERISELSQRTNQFNLSNSKFSKEDVKKLIDSKKHIVLILSAKDKYGDMGIVCCAIINKSNKVVIEAFMLSCRVFGRNFEYLMLDEINALVEGKMLYGVYNMTEQNNRFCDFFENNKIRTIFAKELS